MAACIRPLTAADGEAVVDLSLRAWAPVFASFEHVLGRAVYARLYPDWLTSQADAVRATCTAGQAQVWVAEVGGQPAGFVAVLTDHAEQTGEVDMIAVDPAHQRQGIAAALMDRAVAHLRRDGCTLAVVATGGDPGHAPARRTYERADFTPLPLVRYYKTL